MAASESYLLGHQEPEEQRLIQQAEDLRAETESFLDRVRIQQGDQVAEIGCGPRGALDLLSHRVGPKGRVIGIERNAETARRARRFIEEQGLANVEIVDGDAKSSGFPPNSFDVVYARLVLVNIPEPEQLVREMAALVRPGGTLASHEADYAPHMCDPPVDAWDRILGLLKEYSRLNGIDLFVGRKVHRMLREAGMRDVETHPIVHVYKPGHDRRTILWDFAANLREDLVARGLIGRTELERLMSELKAHLDDPDVLVVSHLYFQVFGRKPG